MSETPAWIEAHHKAWDAKPALRTYYTREHFDRVAAELLDGPTLEVGSGPGFFAAYRPGMVSIDISDQPGVDVCADAHALPFPDATFANAVWVDVLHHMAKPGAMLAEVGRVLRPGGRVAMIEPWTGAIGTVFYRHVHHEDCIAVADPWDAAMPPEKSAMDGNAWIPKAVLLDRAQELPSRTGLRLVKTKPFGALAYLLTGGFQPWGFPPPLVRAATAVEHALPGPILSMFGLRVLYLLEKG